MQLRNALLLTFTALFAACATTAPELPSTNAKGTSFSAFYAQLKQEAKAKGYNPANLDAAFSGKPAPTPEVLKAEQSQPELVRTFAEYTGTMLSSNRIETAVANMHKHTTDLTRTQARSGVSASVVVALWGIETNFGKSQGDKPIIPALVTLAWQSPRSDYFRKETFAALEVIKTTHKNPADLKGSWAGAMGQCQFMPSSYIAYATDGDGDGKADIWNSEADVFASAATYLKERGWNKAIPWRLSINNEFDSTNLKLNSRGLSDPQPLSTFQSRGFKLPTNLKVSGTEKFRYYHPQADGPAYLLGPNFSVILSWNNSSYFAWSVLSLADVVEQESRQ